MLLLLLLKNTEVKVIVVKLFFSYTADFVQQHETVTMTYQGACGQQQGFQNQKQHVNQDDSEENAQRENGNILQATMSLGMLENLIKKAFMK